MKPKFSILITTKNRIDDLKITLIKIQYLIERVDVECLICDDGSIDGTSNYLSKNFPQIILFSNETSRGLIFSRNLLLAKTTAEYSISLDDDAHFLTHNPLDKIAQHFAQNPNCGVLGLRVFWSQFSPTSNQTSDCSRRVRGFVGCGHVWRMSAWKAIPNYPEWFIFYGEEEFAALQLFKENWEIHYFPEILVHHRVDVKSRSQEKDYQIRLRRSLRSGWYLYFMFYPFQQIPRRFSYTLLVQIKRRVFKGDLKATIAILQALGDVIINFPKLIMYSNRFTPKEMEKFQSLSETKIYWTPENN